MKNNKAFDYGDYIVEYRLKKDEPVSFLRKKINTVDAAMKEADELKGKGYHDVLIRTNK